MSSCFGRRRHGDEREREPLLPVYNDDTSLQTRLHEKLHTYQMLRALFKGFMPTNEQLILHLRSILSAEVLNPDLDDLSASGRALVRTTRLWLTQFIDVLQHKNSEDQIQDFIWYLTKARLEIDVADVAARAKHAKVKADATATYKSLQTIGSLMLTNSDFRMFLTDLSTIGREVLRDTAFTLSDVSQKAARKIEPPTESQEAVKNPDGDSERPPSKDELRGELEDVTQVVTEGAAEVVHGAENSWTEHTRGPEGDTMVYRLKQSVSYLRRRKDYSESVSTLSLLIRRYLFAYSHAAAETMQVLEEDAHTNPEADRALRNFWLFITSVGDHEAWKKVESSFAAILEDGRMDPNFDEMVKQLGNLVQDMLTDPDFFNQAEERFQKLREKSNELAAKSSIRDDLDALFGALHAAFHSVLEDADIKKLVHISTRISHLLSPAGNYINNELLLDAVHIFGPLAIQAIQYIPIPRLEVATPAIDLLIENLILEPGRTVNHSSFLPFKLNVSTNNDFEVRKARFGTKSTMTSLLNVKVSGLSIAADDLGYWLRLHSGLLRLVDEGLASFHLDERGIDIELDLEIGREHLEKMVSLRNVRVHVHHLNYTLSQSKFACLAWLFKPLIRPIVRKALEAKIATAIADGLHTLNRELLYARERLRAARIADPEDLWTFVKAVAARLVPAANPDIEARIGIEPAGKGVFRGRHTPGSLVKLWEDEGRDAQQRVYEGEGARWHNDVFDVRTRRA